MFKSIIILTVGVILSCIALIGGYMVLLDEQEVPKTTQNIAQRKPAQARQLVVQKPRIIERDIEAEEAELKHILLAQIKETPEHVDEAWLASFCRYISDEAALKVYLSEIMEVGAVGDRSYQAGQERTKKAPVHDPRFFIELAKQQLYDRDVKKGRLKKAYKSLALGYYRAYHNSKENENVSDDFSYSFFKEMIKTHELYWHFAKVAGDNDGRWLEAVVRVREAAIIDRFYRIKKRHAKTREEFKGTGRSAGLLLMQTDIWRKIVHENLLVLGQIYADLAVNETLYINRQREYAQWAFTSLAMVYQVSYSGEALKLLRQVNKIKRFNLRQIARKNWQKAQLAASNGQVEEADRLYFQAVRNYLQCLSRLEAHRRNILTDEYRRLKRDIGMWNSQKEKMYQSADVEKTSAAVNVSMPATLAQG